MKNPVHIDVIHKIPKFSHSTRKRDKRKIKEIMEAYGYDDDYVENISDDFCQGFNTAKDIIVEMLSDRYGKK